MKRDIKINKKDDPKAYRKALYELEKKEKKQLNITMSLQEYSRLKVVSKQVGLTPTAYAKRGVLVAVDKQIKKAFPPERVAKLLQQTIRPVATNLNQLVRRANRRGVVPSELEQAKVMLEDMQKMVKDALYNPESIEKVLLKYLNDDPKGLSEVERIIFNHKQTHGI